MLLEIVMKRMFLIVGLLTALSSVGPAQADSIGDVEGARAHERQGGYLTRQEREKLRRYGGNDDGYSSRYGYNGGYGYDGGYGYNGAPEVGIYVGPGYGYNSGHRRSYRSYGY
jgi:hypothetical protein